MTLNCMVALGLTQVDEEDLVVYGNMNASMDSLGYVYISGEGKCSRLHNLILPEANRVDHKDRKPSNNRRSNLRAANASLNAANSKLYNTNTSGYKGVGWHKASKSWTAKIGVKINGHQLRLHLGCFSNPEDAAEAYNKAARKHFGEFAYQNIIERKK